MKERTKMALHFPRLVNAENRLLSTEKPSALVTAPFSKQGERLDAEAAEQLSRLIHHIGGQEQIVVTSGYRSYLEQQELYEQALRNYGESYTKSYVAKPGCSEHQLGEAVDLGFVDVSHDEVCPTFEGREISRLFLENMALYGFILRYPKGKERLTGIAYEPWHFRYVGRPHSELIYQQGWTLEEYYTFLNSRGEGYGNKK